MSTTKFSKQPAEVLDYEFDYRAWLLDRTDTITTASVQADAGLTVGAVTQASGIVRVFLSGGTDKQQYKVTATVVTAGGRTKQAEFLLRVVDL